MSDLALPTGVTRKKALFGFIDSVQVSDPHYIRLFDACPYLTRPSIPSRHPALTLFFFFTKFFSGPSKDYFLGFLPDTHPDYSARSTAQHSHLDRQIPEERTHALAKLLRGNASAFEVSRAVLNIVGSLFLRQPAFAEAGPVEVPDSVVHAAHGTLTVPGQLVDPLAAWRALRSRQCVEDFVADRIDADLVVPDVAHHFGAAAQGATRALLLLRSDKKEQLSLTDFRTCMLEAPIAESVVRVPSVETTVGGLFPQDDPLVPGRTIVKLNIAQAAKQSGDDRFLFGAGRDHRQCPFKPVLYKLAKDIQQLSQ